MSDSDAPTGGPTRREILQYGGALTVGSGLAGCSDLTGRSEESAGQSDDGTYSVTMAPAGEVEFSSVPQNVMVYSLLYADMAVAYGHGDAVNSLGFDAEAGGNTLDAYYERLDGVSFDRDGLAQLNTGSGGVNIDGELFYELDSDLHLVDPCLVLSFDGWEQFDIEEIRTNIGPWFGNNYSRSHGQPPEDCRDDYQYYTLWEIAEKVATVFQARSRYEELHAIREEMVETIQADLPPETERPTVGTVIFMEETFFPSQSTTPGFSNAHVRPLGVVDAFAADDVTYETSYDYEMMLEIDPDVILHQYGIASYYDVGAIRETISEHPVGEQLSAVENDRIYPSGNPVQGPIMNLFQLEATAKQLYPDVFGEWPGYVHGEPYPEISADEQLFDRQEIAEIIAGDR
ncbi:ABC transporter substrate-binding protein [Natronorubrum halophilum]|uniref:ABC transporter substrate-binding protein n=1 Tax=Natronorubrum halophilum TaxID=1702106 RepID=UPI000EF65273|nr:ABC transporter substrate-binding protein [Natronorubrum halophilum]